MYGAEEVNAWAEPLHEKETTTEEKKKVNGGGTAPTAKEKETIGNDDEAMKEDFASKLSFMQSDFKKQLEQSANDREKTKKEQEEKVNTVKTQLDKSMSEFRSYVKTIFARQDESMVALQEECKATNAELKRQSAYFSTQLEEIREEIKGSVTEIVNAVRAANGHKVPLVMQTGELHTQPNNPTMIADSPLDPSRTGQFVGMGVQTRAQQIREAIEAERQQNLTNNGSTTTSLGRSGQS